MCKSRCPAACDDRVTGVRARSHATGRVIKGEGAENAACVVSRISELGRVRLFPIVAPSEEEGAHQAARGGTRRTYKFGSGSGGRSLRCLVEKWIWCPLKTYFVVSL